MWPTPHFLKRYPRADADSSDSSPPVPTRCQHGLGLERTGRHACRATKPRQLGRAPLDDRWLFPLVNRHDRILGTHTMASQDPPCRRKLGETLSDGCRADEPRVRSKTGHCHERWAASRITAEICLRRTEEGSTV